MKLYLSIPLIFIFALCISAQVIDSVRSPQPAKTPAPINTSENLPVDRDKYGKVLIIKTGIGDSAYSIADGYGIPLTELEQFNKLTPDAKLASGSEIKIPVTDEVFKTLARIDQIITDSGKFFRQGLFNIQDNRRSQAGDDFDKAVEVFIMSGVNVNHNKKLQSCYSQLIETVYRMEFPVATQQPNIRSLSATCDWAIENDLADKVAKLVLTTPVETNSVTLVSSVGRTVAPQGFNEQKFEPSPLDKLAKLEVSPEEKEVDKTNLSRSKPLLKPVELARTVKAKSGDTIAILASREGVSAVELAKYNGLLPTTILAAGREIKIPPNFDTDVVSWQEYRDVDYPTKKVADIGAKPAQAKDGKVQAVVNYINETFNDPYSVRFVKWSAVEKSFDSWKVSVRFRAKNGFNAYILSEMIFYIRKNKVIDTTRVF